MSLPDSRIDMVNLSGGIIGLFISSPLRALRDHNSAMVAQGYRVHQVQRMGTTNPVAVILQLLILVLTLFLWTRTGGFVVVSQRADIPTAASHFTDTTHGGNY